MSNALKAMQDEDFMRDFNRELYGDQIDDYMRRLTGHESYYDEQAREENERYWVDYTKNTGAESKYPIRTGEEWNQAITTLPMGLTQLPGKFKAIDMLYGGQR